MRRQLVRLDEATPRIAVGKFLGAVGTGAAQGEGARELQRLILTHLGLQVPLATTQVVGRDSTSSMSHGYPTLHVHAKRFSGSKELAEVGNC